MYEVTLRVFLYSKICLKLVIVIQIPNKKVFLTVFFILRVSNKLSYRTLCMDHVRGENVKKDIKHIRHLNVSFINLSLTLIHNLSIIVFTYLVF